MSLGISHIEPWDQIPLDEAVTHDRAPVVAPASPSGERTPYRMDVIGEYQQREATELLDRDKERIAIEPGAYPVVGALSLDGGRILEAGVMYQGVNVATGELTGLVEFHKPERLRELVRETKLELAWSVKPEMLAARSAQVTPLDERRQEKNIERAPDKRVALRR